MLAGGFALSCLYFARNVELLKDWKSVVGSLGGPVGPEDSSNRSDASQASTALGWSVQQITMDMIVSATLREPREAVGAVPSSSLTFFAYCWIGLGSIA